MHHRPGLSRFNVALCAALAGAAVASFGGTASAQTQFTGNFPFPSRKPVMGLTTSVLTTHELRAQYELWKSRFIERCNQGDARMRYPESNNDTRSEGIGYGMVIAAYFGDQPTFDGLWDYYQRASSNGLMNWRRDGCNAGGGGGDTGSASDADVDAAFGLIIANRQWGGYAGDASTLVGRIRGVLFQNGCPGILLAGSQFAACGCINPSYIPTGYYPSFGTSDAGQAQFWTTARTNSYTYFAAVSNDNTGLVPAWSQSNGSTNLQCNGTPQVSGGGNTNEFQADAARTPWRVAMDFQWTGDQRAATFLGDIADFAAAQRIVQIVTRYSLAGQQLEGANGDATGFRSTYTIGGFASAMTASTQANLDAFTGAWQSMYLAGDSTGPNNTVAPHAFNSSLALLYGLTITGLAWDPAGANPARVEEPQLNAQAGNQLENGDFDQGFLGWSMANLDDPATAGARAEGFAVHRGGELEIRIPRAAARPQDAFEVRLSQPVSIQAGRNYLLSVRARAAGARPLNMTVAQVNAPYTTYGALGNRRSATTPVSIGTEMESYEWVFAATASDNAAQFNLDVGNNASTLIIDDIFFGETDRPISVPGELSGDPVGMPDPNTPPGSGGSGGTTTPPGTPPGGGGTTPPAGGPGGGVQIPNQDIGSNPGGAQPGGSSTVGAAPPVPMGRAPGNGSCRTKADCGMYECSTLLWICYDPNTGYVADPTQPTGWSLPPQLFDADGDGTRDDDCGTGRYYWPVINGCYDPVSGYAFNAAEGRWIFVGDNWVADQTFGDGDGEDSATCAIGAGPGAQGSMPWLLSGALFGALVTFGARRRRRAAR